MITKALALVIALLPAICNASLFGDSNPAAEREWKAINEVAYEQHAHFTYVSDMQKHGVEHHAEQGVTGDEPFSGDCEEFMQAAFVQLLRRGVVVAPVFTKVGDEPHVMACGQYYCTDTMHRGAFAR